MKRKLRVCDHQSVVTLEGVPEMLESTGGPAAEAAWQARCRDEAPLGNLDQIEVALVDDETIARVHAEFMNDPAPTDVITFDHGEIVISVETGARQAEEHREPLERELLRYLVHGLLHLAGHEDGEEEARAKMIAEQERIVARLG